MPVRRFRTLLLAGFLAACQSNDVTGNARSRAAAPTGVTLRVTNASCVAGHCDSIIVLGFPTDGPITPGGLWSIDFGLVTTPTACITLPPADTARVTGPRTDGTVGTTLYVWTPEKALSVGSIPPSGSRFMADPSTAAFVPASAVGWRITLPGGTEAVSDSACGR